jgi:hypothetical protein
MTRYCFLCHTTRDANGRTTTIVCRRCTERKQVDDYLLNFIGHTSRQEALAGYSLCRHQMTEFQDALASSFAHVVKKDSLGNKQLPAEGVSELSQGEIHAPETIRDFGLWLRLQDQKAKKKDEKEQQKIQERESREKDKAALLLLQRVVDPCELFEATETRAQAGRRKFETQQRMLLLSLSQSSTGRMPVPMAQSRADPLAQSRKTTKALPTVPKHGRMAALHGS